MAAAIIPIVGAIGAAGAGIAKGVVDGIGSYKLKKTELENAKYRMEMDFK